MKKTTINIDGRILDLSTPQVMGIVNLTPDSFYTSCDPSEENRVLQLVEKHLIEEASIIDIGAYSTRPGAPEVSMEEEWKRLERNIHAIKTHFPDAILSVDTFRAEVARRAVENGVHIVNDISGGELDEKMAETIAALHVPYILMHMRGTPQTMQTQTTYADLLSDILDYFQKKMYRLQEMGVADVIIDPGFGFAKTLEQNYQLLNEMDKLSVLQAPLLVGVSHKSMIYKLLGCEPADALNGTSAVHMIALQKGASILRVHEVKPAVECIKIYRQCMLG